MAANLDIDLPRRTISAARPHAVYLRRGWADAWTRVPWLWASELVWSLAPNVGTAQLRWRFGRGMREGEKAIALVARLTGKQFFFVKVECDTADPNAPLTWYGTVEIDGQEMLGIFREGDARIPSGHQHLDCLGLAQILYRQPIAQAVWSWTPGTLAASPRAPDFNPLDSGGKAIGNRTPGTSQWSFCGSLSQTPAYWSTRDIVNYTTISNQPLDDLGRPFTTLLSDEHLILPSWDKPTIRQHGKTVGQVLDEAMDRGRGLSWRLDVDEATNAVSLVPISLLGGDVTTPSGILRKNPRRLDLAADGCPDWRPSVLATYHQVVDRVTVRGAPRTSTMTFNYTDNTIEKGWTDALETEYEAAASGDADYAALGTELKQRRNEERRGREKYARVFRRFQIADAWNHRIDEVPAFPAGLWGAAWGDEVAPTNPRQVEIEPVLALREGYDYWDLGDENAPVAPLETVPGKHDRLPPLVIFEDPVEKDAGGVTGRMVEVEKISKNANLESAHPDKNDRWHARVEIPDAGRAILLDVSGAPQHILDPLGFDRLPVDPHLGGWNWHNARFTLTLREDRYCEGVWPPLATPLEINRLIRPLLLYAGDGYRQDWLVPGTVIAVHTDGTLRFCTGGGWIHNDEPLLTSRAKQIWEYYRRPRRALSLEGHDINLLIRLGDYVESFGAADPLDVQAVVSEIRVSFPEGPPEGVPPPTISYTTAFAELDLPGLLFDRVA